MNLHTGVWAGCVDKLNTQATDKGFLSLQQPFVPDCHAHLNLQWQLEVP